MINASVMSKNEIANSIRNALKAARKSGTIPKEWRISVSSSWSGYTPSIYLKIKNHNAPRGSSQRESYERLIRDVANVFNYNNSRIEFDYFDVGYYINLIWEEKE